ncbi:MAG: hypothetical protein GY855_17790, partial [candidate division Zixibacteria bacterium]|nr:hypothetical protein [candidate division Zixibacteria bacterium]
GGIYKECSISFTFSLPECSICGDDIRRCGHRPFKEYQTASGEKSTASFNYRQIDKVLETSIVYRGSVHDTTLTNELFSPDIDQLEIKGNTEKPALPTINRIWTSEILDPTHQYKIRPAYESIRVVINNSDSGIVAQYCDNTIIDSQKLNKYLHKLSLPNGKYSLDCRLIGYRGKERQKLYELSKYFEGKKSNVTRLELRIYDLLITDNDSNELSELLIPSKVISKNNLIETVNNLSTRFGVEITDCQTDKQYLLTNKKRIFLNINSKEEIAGGYKYGLSGRVGGASFNQDVYCQRSDGGGLNELVQDWVDGTYNNYGIVIKSDLLGIGDTVYIYSSENFNESLYPRPKLYIEYTPSLSESEIPFRRKRIIETQGVN